MSMSGVDFLRELVGGEVLVISRPIAEALGLNTALVLREFAYWSKRSDDGWVYRTEAEIEAACLVAPKAFAAVRKSLKASGVLQERREGLPARMFYAVDWDCLAEIVGQNFGRTTYAEGRDLRLPGAGHTLKGKERKQGLSLPSHEGSDPSVALSPGEGSHVSESGSLEGGALGGGTLSQEALSVERDGAALLGHMERVGLHMGNPDAAAAHARGLNAGGKERRKEQAAKKALEAKRRQWLDAWLAVYPREVLAEDAWREFRTLGAEITPELMDAMTAGLDAWLRSEQWQKEDGRFIPGAVKFIRNRLWENPPKPARHVMELPDA
jgi:hypothetical protein